ncbi:Eaa protein [Salmonella enterica]|nr:Eaa protein [Salmonella enterica]EHT6963511.1 Eaa protein [Salmonella enterica]
MTTITKERIELFIKNPLENGLTRGEQMELARIALAALNDEPVAYNQVQRDMMKDIIVRKLGGNLLGHKLMMADIHAVTMALIQAGFRTAQPASERERIRHEHAEWSYADPVVFTDERNLHHIAMGRETSLIWGKQNQEVGDIPLYRHAQPVPVDKEFIPKNLDKALGVVGVALPESKEEFNFQIERWIQRLIDRVIRYADEFKEQPAPVVPDEMATSDDMNLYQKSFAQGYNACRAAMLQGVEQPQNARQNIPENIPDGNSPAIPDDWVVVPKEPTQAMIKAWLSEVANFRGHAAGYKAALAAAPQQEMK